MSANSKIEWTETTWNPIAGCAVVSPGCTNCYAMGEAHRLGELIGQAKYKGLTRVVNGKPVWTGEVRVWEKALFDPLKWRKPKRIFVNSMSDLFAEGVDNATIDRIFAVMRDAPQHTFQVLTKRADRMREYMRHAKAALGVLPNVWLGVSVEDQRRADERIPLLLDTPAAVRWISAEPLLGPVDLVNLHPRDGVTVDAIRGQRLNRTGDYSNDETHLDWVVVGGESGPDARPMYPHWARQLRDQCEADDVPFFFKQWGENWPAEKTKIGPDGEVWRTSPNGKDVWFLDEIGKTAPPQVRFIRYSKKATGRTLDGRTHDAYPQVKP
jgi:protein gp37